MRLFGIILAVVNLLAGAGFVYLATQDWKGRQTINETGFTRLLLLQGLPVEGAELAADDETPFVIEMGGGESSKTVSKKLLDSYFAANTSAAGEAAARTKVPLAANTTVTSQLAEVKRVQGLIKAELAKDMPPADKIARLKGWLLPQAENYDIRTEYQAIIAPTDASGQPKSAEQLTADAAKLEAILDARFAAVVNKPQLSDSPAVVPPEGAALTDKDKLAKSAEWKAGSSLDDIERRLRLAHLLVHLDQDAAWQKRVAVVVGLRRYVRAIAAQVLRFEDMIAHVNQGIPGDQAAFAKQLTQLREKATQNAERARAVAVERGKLEEQKTTADSAVERRRTQIKELTDQLTKVKAEVDELLVRQTGIEQQLFEIQREVGLTLEDVYRLDALLAATERERYGQLPRTEP